MSKLYGFLYGLGIFILMAMVYGIPLMLLWNIFIIDILHTQPISFWQAVAMRVVAAILFGKNITVRNQLPPQPTPPLFDPNIFKPQPKDEE